MRTTSHCLHVVGNTEMAEYGKASLPADMSSRFRVCTELAEAVKKLGYREEISFHLFLYPAEKSSRELIAFLLDRLPQAMRGDEGGGDIAGDKAIAVRNITAALSAARSRMHVLPVCRPRTLRAAVDKRTGWAYPSVPLRSVPLVVPPGEGASSGYADGQGLPAVTQQTWGPHGLAPSLFEANLLAQEKKKEINLDASADDLAQAKVAFDKNIKEALRSASGKSKGKARDSLASLASLLEDWAGAKGPSHSSRFGRAAAFGQDQDDGLVALDSELSREERQRIAEEERLARLAREEEERQQMLADMQEELNKLNDLAESLAGDYNLQLLRHRQVEADVEEETVRTEERIQEYKLKKKTLALLANRDENVAQLRSVSAETAKRLLELGTEWERVRLPLVEDLRSRKAELLRRKEGMQWKIARIKEMRESMVALADAVRSKDELAKALGSEYEGLPKSALRSSYTRRLQELSKNMQKQKRDIGNILNDTRNIQADIATSWDTMKRRSLLLLLWASFAIISGLVHAYCRPLLLVC